MRRRMGWWGWASWIVAPLALVGELSFTLWLLIKGTGYSRPTGARLTAAAAQG